MKTNLLIAVALLAGSAGLAQEVTNKQETNAKVLVKAKPVEQQASPGSTASTTVAVKGASGAVSNVEKKVQRTQAAVSDQVQATKEAAISEVQQTTVRVDQAVQEVRPVQAEGNVTTGVQATINNSQVNQQAAINAQVAVSPQAAVTEVKAVKTTAMSKVQKTGAAVQETVPAIRNTIKPLPVQAGVQTRIKTGIGLGIH